MSYTKQNFQNGQTLNAEHLNYIEDGIVSLLALHEGNYLIRYTIPAESSEFNFSFARPKGKKNRALIYFYDPQSVCGAKTWYSEGSSFGTSISTNPYEFTANGTGSVRIHLSCNTKTEDTDFEVLIIDPDADTMESFLVNQIVNEQKVMWEYIANDQDLLREQMMGQLSYVKPSTSSDNPTRAGELRLRNEKDLYISVYSEDLGQYIWSGINHATSNI